MMNEQHDIVVIGGGASATLLAHALRRQYGRDCLIIDPSPQPALGAAYGTRCIGHLLNVPARGMSAVADDPGHFVDWLRRQIDPGIDPDSFIPRAVYGLYLQQLLGESGARLIQARAISCTPCPKGILIALDTGLKIEAGAVILALGHFPPAPMRGVDPSIMHNPRYHHDVWRDALLRDHQAQEGRTDALHPDETLLVIGSGLTAIDMVIKARLQGHKGQIRLLSRRASLPEMHRTVSLPENPVVSPIAGAADERGRLADYVAQFHAALRKGVAWRAAIDSLRPVSNDLFTTLSDDEQARFDRHLRRRWDVARHRIAPQIARFLHQEQIEGRLEVNAGRISGIAPCPGGLKVTALHEGHTTHYVAGHVLNCTGPDTHYRRAGSQLLDDLLAQGLASPGRGGSGLKTRPDGALIDSSGSARLPLYTLGPARIGTLFETIAIPEIRQQALDLATILTA